jgi:hypothetical protein
MGINRLRLELIDYRDTLRQRLLKKHNDNESYKGLKDLIETYLELAERNALKDPIIGDIKKQEIIDALSNYTIDLSFIPLNYCNEEERARELFNISRTTSAFISHLFNDTNVDIKALIENYREIEKNLLGAFGNYGKYKVDIEDASENPLLYPYEGKLLIFSFKDKFMKFILADIWPKKDCIRFSFKKCENYERIIELTNWEVPQCSFLDEEYKTGNKEQGTIYNPCTLIDLLNIAYANGYDYLKLRLELFTEFPLNGYIDKTIKQALDVLSKICFVKQCIDNNIERSDGKGYYILKPLALYDVEERLFYLNQHLAYDESGNLIFKRREENEIFIYQPFINSRIKIAKKIYGISLREKAHLIGENVLRKQLRQKPIFIDKKTRSFLEQFGFSLYSWDSIKPNSQEMINLESSLSIFSHNYSSGASHFSQRLEVNTNKLFTEILLNSLLIMLREGIESITEDQIEQELCTNYNADASNAGIRYFLGITLGLEQMGNNNKEIVEKYLANLFSKLKNVAIRLSKKRLEKQQEFYDVYNDVFLSELAQIIGNFNNYVKRYFYLTFDLIYDEMLYDDFYHKSSVINSFKDTLNIIILDLLKEKTDDQDLIKKQQYKKAIYEFLLRFKQSLDGQENCGADLMKAKFSLLSPFFEQEKIIILKDPTFRQIIDYILNKGINASNKELEVMVNAFYERFKNVESPNNENTDQLKFQ